MARELSATLANQQKWGLISWPYLIAKIRRRWGGVIRHQWQEVKSFSYILRPNGVGDEENITQATSGPGHHWEDVDDETPDEFDTCVAENTQDNVYRRDLYSLPTLEHIGNISKVRVYARTGAYNAPPNFPFKIALKTHDTPYESPEIPLTASFVTYSYTWATNPNTGLAWTWDEIDDLQCGIALKSKSYGGGDVFEACTQVYVVVQTDASQDDDYLHTATMPSDGSLIRLRVANPDTTKDLYYQRTENPGPTSSLEPWESLGIQNVIAVASCSNGTNVSQFYINSGGDVYQRISSDSGASWGAWSKIITAWGYGAKGFDVAYKPNGDMALTFLHQQALREHCDTGDNNQAEIYGFFWWVHSFIPLENHTLDYIELKLFRVGNPGTITVSLYLANDNGWPTGGPLRTTTIEGSTITDVYPGLWYKINFADIALDSTNRYCILVKAPSGNPLNIIYWRASTSNPYPDGHMSYSDDSGSTWTIYSDWDAMFRIYAYTIPPDRPSLYCYFDENGASWQPSANNANPLSTATGISIFYSEDWNVIATYGAVDALKGVAACIFGDGTRQAAGTWSAWISLIDREATEPFTYRAPFVRRPDTTRLYFVEAFTQEETQERLFYSHTPPSANFADYAWLEPVPMNVQSQYGLCPCQHGSYAWLINSKSVYCALATDEELDISDKLLIVDMRQYPDVRKGYIRITIDNTNGQFNSFARLGDELTIGLGYKTPAGNEYSLASSFWITKYKLESPPWYPLRMILPTGIIGTLVIEAQDAWDFLRRYKSRRTYTWSAGQKSVKELLQYFIARSGLDFEVLSQSSAVQNFKPEFSITVGTSYRTIVKNLLKMVPDQLIFREAKAILRNPTTDEAVDWTYHNMLGQALLVFRGRYGSSAWDPNRAEVWGDTFMKMGAEWPQVEKVRDRLSRVATPTYPDLDRAGERATAELRRAEILTGEESWLNAPANCGLEPWDKIKITDTVGGVTNILRRVIRIKTYWSRRHWQYHQVLVLGAD